MNLLQLFLAFLQIGALSFGGGYAALPIINEIIVQQHHWLTNGEMIDVVTISQMTPGPIAINAATFVGTKIAGLPGAVIATIGNVIPQTLMMMTLAYFIFRGKKLPIVENILRGLRPGVVGLIITATVAILRTSIYSSGSIDIIAGISFMAGLVLCIKGMSAVKLIGLGAIIGIVSMMVIR